MSDMTASAVLVEPRRIEVGLNNNIMAEIKSGLDESDQVVTSATAGGRGGQAGGGAPGGNRFGGGGLLGGGRP